MNTVLIVLEASGTTLKRTSFEAVTAALLFSDAASCVGVLLNGTTDQISAAGEYGLTNVVNVVCSDVSPADNVKAAVAIANVATVKGASVVLFSANAFGRDVAPRVAVRLQAGYLPDCVELHGTALNIEAVRPVYAGKASVRVKSTTGITVASLRPNVFTARKASTVAVDCEEQAMALSNVRGATVTGVQRNEGTLDVAEADIVVSGGRGLKAPEHFHLVEDLAKSLGAAVGASRAVVDAGWRPHREQVGQTGKTVSPNMYVACGISGAVQHLAGMSSSRIIVAINKDKDAPIFKIADYGVVGDVFEVLPKLTKRISAITGR